jgi:hypothetical protein
LFLFLANLAANICYGLVIKSFIGFLGNWRGIYQLTAKPRSLMNIESASKSE